MKENTAKQLNEMDLENKIKLQEIEEQFKRKISENIYNMDLILNNFQNIISNNNIFN